MAPWLAQFLIDLTNSGRDMSRFLGAGVVTDNDRASAYAGYVREQWAQALSLIDEAGIAVPQVVREWNQRIQGQDPVEPTASGNMATQPQHVVKPTARAAERPGVSEHASPRDKNEEQPPLGRRGSFQKILSSPRSWFRSADGTDGSVEAIAQALYSRWCDEQCRWHHNPIVPSWEELDKSRKRSHREQAGNIVTSLRSIGCEIASLQDSATDFPFTEEEVDKLAEARHDRWVNEQIEDGRRLGPRDPAQKTTPYLAPFRDLPPDIAEYDRIFVREIPAILASAHLQVIRTG